MGWELEHIAAWLSVKIIAGKVTSLLWVSRWAARTSPTASASNTVCSVALPRCWCRVATWLWLMNRVAAAPTWLLWLEPSVKSGSTPVGGSVKSGRRRMKGESRGLDKRLVRPELVTAWIQRLRTTSVDPLRRFRSSRGDGDRDGDGQNQE